MRSAPPSANSWKRLVTSAGFAERRRGLRLMLSVTVVLVGVNLLANALAVERFPLHVYYHDQGDIWRLRALVTSLIIGAFALVIPRLALAAGIAAAGGLSNVSSGLIWPGAPDYFSYGPRIFNTSDICVVSGQALLLLTMLLVLLAERKRYQARPRTSAR